MGSRDAYRAFRDAVLKKSDFKRGSGWRPARYDDENELHPFGVRRAAITEFRSNVAYRLEAILRESPEHESHIRRALGIPASIPLLPNRWQVAGQFGLFFLPEAVLLHRAYSLLGRVRCFEGRNHVFMHFIRRTLPRCHYYDDRLDFSLRRFRPARTVQALEHLQRFEVGVLKAALCLGLRTPAEVVKAFPSTHDRLAGSLLLALVEEGAIQRAEELSWVGRKVWNPSGREPQTEEVRHARGIIRCLLANGVERRLVAAIFQYALGGLAPDQLAENLDLLLAAGVTDVSMVFVRVGDRLWRASAANWKFVLDTVGARSAEDIGRFKSLLDSPRNVSAELVRRLFALGADLEGLAGCQSLLLAVARDHGGVPPPVDELMLLTSPPHALNIDQIAQCTTYLGGKRELAAFLKVLADHGYGGAEAVLAFQVCYSSVSPEVLARLLAILGERGRGELIPLVATWVLQAGQGGYLDAFKYLVTAVDMPSLAALQQALKLVALGTPLLRYLVEERGLTSFKEIRDWYYRDANGIDGYRSWRAFDAVDKVLLDDACERKQFNQLDGNQRCIADAVNQRIKVELGSWPFQADESVREKYRIASEQAVQRERAPLLPLLPAILRRTGGILLQSLLEGAWKGSHDLEAKLAQLAPLVKELLAGRGPTRLSLSPLEVDAIALLYRTSAGNVASQWPQLIGREQDLGQLRLDPYYPLAWTRAQWQLQRPLARSGFFALLKAVECAGRFAPSRFDNIFTACQRLSPKQLNERSADVGSMALHLGILLAIAAEDEVVAQWTQQGFDALTRIDEESLLAYQRLGELLALFDVVLPDALDAHVEGFVKRFSDDDAFHLASRLGNISSEAEPMDGRTRLRSTLVRVRDKVLRIYLTWARHEWRKYGKSSSASHEATPLQAIVSKHPAAFFAKAAVNLCTSSNVEMWRESRQSHLLMVDPAGQRLAGMALLYVEVMPGLDPKRPSLVIRALNPTDEMLVGHAADSIVDGFLDVAIRIAQDNDLACVAFPSPLGMHLLSNREAIEADLKNRYVKRSVHHFARVGHTSLETDPPFLRDTPQRVDVPFDAYERGQTTVDTLYVIWRPEPIAEAASEDECMAVA